MRYQIVFISILISVNCYCQEKKDSRIIVSVSDTTNLFNRIALVLVEKGYSFENKEQQLGFISTNEKPVSKTLGSLKIRALIKDNTITFTGVFALDGEVTIGGVKLQRTFDPVLFTGDKNGSYKICWREIEGIAKQFGSEITYSK